MGILTYDRHYLPKKFQALLWLEVEDYLYNNIKMHIFSEKYCFDLPPLKEMDF